MPECVQVCACMCMSVCVSVSKYEHVCECILFTLSPSRLTLSHIEELWEDYITIFLLNCKR